MVLMRFSLLKILQIAGNTMGSEKLHLKSINFPPPG
jgi:hypothetical protein